MVLLPLPNFNSMTDCAVYMEGETEQSRTPPETWVGRVDSRWKCDGREVRMAKFNLQQKGRLVSGRLTIRTPSWKRTFGVTEELSGIIDGDRLMLDGVSSEVHPAGVGHEYRLDSFDLHLHDSVDERRLVGIHRCDLGTEEAILEKTPTRYRA